MYLLLLIDWFDSFDYKLSFLENKESSYRILLIGDDFYYTLFLFTIDYDNGDGLLVDELLFLFLLLLLLILLLLLFYAVVDFLLTKCKFN